MQTRSFATPESRTLARPVTGFVERSRHMGMFDTVGTAAGQERRKENTLRKLERMKKTLRHEEPDRVPVSDFFWGGFIERWRNELGLPADANPYYYYDLDWIVTVSNMDPWIRPFETIRRRRTRSWSRPATGPSCGRCSVAPCPSSSAGRPTRWRSSKRPSSTIRATRGATFRRATIRSPASATASSGTRRRGSTRSSRSGPIFPSTAASPSARSA